ncbi:YciI family protein [Bdellovibrio svalbardensis]|uniref:YciI family protein n=1 Tax=Bdellovibrio svalbardensis TaxID=2972972 RepID=A0ABT6DL58_9BACT|nr:YciI family protein [Bdellovibrio svalbardensis]MDG0817314.1 YciI family protein [Bdellovibrio svalbardensis]
MFVITLTYLKPLSEVEKQLPAHREFLKQGYSAGMLLASGPMIPRTGGIILARGNDKNAILNFLESDPFKKNDIAAYEVVEFDPVLFSDDFAKSI